MIPPKSYPSPVDLSSTTMRERQLPPTKRRCYVQVQFLELPTGVVEESYPSSALQVIPGAELRSIGEGAADPEKPS